MFFSNSAAFCFVFIIGQTRGLIELPQVDDNNILTTEAAIRNTINTLFHTLKVEGIRKQPKFKQYSTVYNHFISFTLQDYKTLREIAKLTRVDQRKINNETANFMTAINELLNEDNDLDQKDFPEIDDESVVDYVDQFLTRLKDFKEQYGVNNRSFHINEDVYAILKNDDVQLSNYTIDNVNLSESAENDVLQDENEFWKPEMNTRRIYQGYRTKIKYFPFMASIQIFNKFHCGGSIITSDLVITASSCLQLAWNNRFFRENPAFLSVRVGSTFYNGGGESIPVLEVYFHPDYNPKTLSNNLCLLRLIRKLKFHRRTKKIKKIEFDTHPTSLPMTTSGITIVGWGARGASNIIMNPWDNALTSAILDIYPLRECQEVYSKQYVTHKNFCAGFFSKGGGACNRDVGGPGIVSGILAGVVSFGSPVCGTPDAPTVFTKIGFYSKWIERIMDMEVPTINQRTTLKPDLDFYTIVNPPIKTTFKIAPISGKMKPIPLTEVDVLRMLTQGKLFKEFMSTMFNKKDLAEYLDLFQLDETNVATTQNTISRPDATVTKRASMDPVEETTPMEPEVVTVMGEVEPEKIKVSSEDETPTQDIFDFTVGPDQDVKAYKYTTLSQDTYTRDLTDIDAHMEGLAAIDKNVEGLLEIDKQIDDLVNIENNKREFVNVENNNDKNEKKSPQYNNDNIESLDDLTSIRKVIKEPKRAEGKVLEKDLVNLINDIDLKEIIDSLSSAEGDKLSVDEKVIKLFHEKEAQDKKDPTDDSILTLLYLSSEEKVKKPGEKQGLKPDYDVEDDEDNDDENEYDEVDKKGISIEPDSFKDLTYRNSNVSRIFGKLSRHELEKLLYKHLRHLQPDMW